MTTPSSSNELFAGLLNAATQEQAASTAPATPVVDPVEEDDTPAQPSELDMLKQRAKLMGVQFSNNIGVEALKAKINAKLAGESQVEEAPVPAVEASKPALTERQIANLARKQMQMDALRLVRIRITNLNPNKKDLPGEIFTVSNRVIGAQRKFVPYGEASENGFHVPFIIYEQLKEREFQQIRNYKDSNGRPKQERKLVKEFAIEVLPQLTELELARLAASQAAKGGLD
ncbi:hypothetical protein [Mesorhizobium sp. CN2-181]|uniref:hypothetical protein n=1 Tax=Mesorhizobium yinganensis TaxID=3157707 RepID=UPI0032B7D048